MGDVTESLLRKIRESHKTAVAEAYSRAVYDQSVNWREVNAAIIERWGDTGLDAIKRLAWSLRELNRPRPVSAGDEGGTGR